MKQLERALHLTAVILLQNQGRRSLSDEAYVAAVDELEALIRRRATPRRFSARLSKALQADVPTVPQVSLPLEVKS